MIVGIIGSKDQLVSEYRVMLAEKLLNKSDYDIDSEIRTLELLKVSRICLLLDSFHFVFLNIISKEITCSFFACSCFPDTFWGE